MYVRFTSCKVKLKKKGELSCLICPKTNPRKERRARRLQREAMESEAKKHLAGLRSEYTMQII